jgi:uracil-DNA glycosylase
MGKKAVPKIADVTPPKECITACSERLYEEIYEVDPIVIVLLGATVTSTLIKKHIVSISKDAGTPIQIVIPGKLTLPKVTKRAMKVVLTERNNLTYVAIPTLHPSHVNRVGTQDYSDVGPLKVLHSSFKVASTILRKVAEYYDIIIEDRTTAYSSDEDLDNG